MDMFPLELLIKIEGYLSINERKELREVSKMFNSSISHLILKIIKMDNKFGKNNSIKELSSINSNLILVGDSSYHLIYKNINDYIYDYGVHRYYNLTNHKNIIENNCVTNGCREKRAEYIYLSQKENHQNTYQKKYIPYCHSCFIHCSNII